MNVSQDAEEQVPSDEPIPAEPSGENLSDIQEVETEAAIEEIEVEAEAIPEPKPLFQIPAKVQIGLGIFSIFVVGVIYYLRVNPVVGLFVDDGWYVVLAKAIATGNGYTLINSPTPGILPLYPPGFPFLLSLVFLIFPSFPENVWALKLISILAVFGSALISYRYFSELKGLTKPLSWMIALVTVTSSQVAFFAAETVMSESLYGFVVISTIYLAEKKFQKEIVLKSFLFVGLLAGYAYLVRSTGIAIIAAIAICILRERKMKPLFVFLGVIAALILPWVIYTKTHQLTPQMKAEQNSYIVHSYGEQFWRGVATDEESGQITVADLPSRVVNNLGQIILRDMARLLISPVADSLIYRDVNQEKITGEGNIAELNSSSGLSIILTIFVLMGFISVIREKISPGELVIFLSVGITLLWPWEVLRFLVPLSPFFLFYFIRGIMVFHKFYQKLNEQNNPFTRNSVAAGFLILILLVNVYAQYIYISRIRSDKTVAGRDWIATFHENREMLKWISENTVENAVLATDNPPLNYLYTGRKSVGVSFPERQWELWKKLGVTHIVRGSNVVIEGADEQESRFSIPYRSKGELNLRVLDLGSVDGRKTWVNQ